MDAEKCRRPAKRSLQSGFTLPRAVSLCVLTLSAAWVAGCARPSVTQGRALYAGNGCASCHGKEGYGDGPTAPNLPVKPIDFHDVSQFTHGDSEEAIAKTIAEGVAVDHSVPALHLSHHELVMPSFAHLSETERSSIALYIVSLRAGAGNGEGSQ